MPGFVERLMLSNYASQRCPECDESLQAESMNIKEGVALCPQCGHLAKLSQLVSSARSVKELLAKPPRGCSIEKSGSNLRAVASLGSLAGFIGTALFGLLWNGITSVFVLLAIAGLYTNLIGPLPNWFPAPGVKNGKPEMNGAPMDLGGALFLCVFLIPFVTIGLGMLGAAIMNLLGKVVVVVDGFDAYVSTGVGFIRWKRTFDPREIRAIDYATGTWRSSDSDNKYIVIEADKSVKFGTMLQSDRMDWLRAELRRSLLPQKYGMK